jgi:hypothetical protein
VDGEGFLDRSQQSVRQPSSRRSTDRWLRGHMRTLSSKARQLGAT